jgi:opacity protein-like surface antigen
MLRIAVLAVLASGALMATVSPVGAEWFADLYVGAAITRNQDVKIDQPDLGLRTTDKDVRFDESVLFGGRVGYWFESLSLLGIGLDAFHFRPDVSRQTRTAEVCFGGACVPQSLAIAKVELDVTVIGFDVLLRYPLLKSPQFPRGRLQPYLTAGPAIFIAHGKDSTNFVPANQSDTEVEIGVKAGAGLAWQFHRHIAIFGEYRFTHFSPEFEIRNLGGRTTLKTDLNTHNLIGGVSFRF